MMRAKWTHLAKRLLICAIVLVSSLAEGQNGAGAEKVDVRARIMLPVQQPKNHAPPSVLWLKPLPGSPSEVFSARNNHYTLLQKNRAFTPHLLVVPVGSEVLFPNADPFFHNVFSLFNGKRFDLGLYEAGSTKGVDFSREGVSYIFCNIHPEMSAVVIALSTPFYAIADPGGKFSIKDVPAGDYEMHVWVEGLTQAALDRFTRTEHLSPPGSGDLGTLDATAAPRQPDSHLNKFGQPYDRDSKPLY
jgi:plastocyanin